MVQRTDPDLNVIQALILVPTRELASQYVEELGRIAQGREVVPFAIFGGVKMSLQQAKLHHKVHILVATPGRLLDFRHVSHVINYEAPLSHEAYTHRTGRAGRMGRTGIAMTLVTDRDLQNLNRLLQINRIEPVWRGRAPELVRPSSGQEGAKRKRVSRHKTARRRGHRTAPTPTCA